MRKSIEEKVERFDDTSTHTPKDGQCQLLSRYCNWESNVPPKRSSHAKFQVNWSIGGWVTDTHCPINQTLLSPFITIFMVIFGIESQIYLLCFTVKNDWLIEYYSLKGKRLSQLPPRSQCIQPRTMDSIPREEDEEWKKIGWKRIRISCGDIDNVFNSLTIQE